MGQGLARGGGIRALSHAWARHRMTEGARPQEGPARRARRHGCGRSRPLGRRADARARRPPARARRHTARNKGRARARTPVVAGLHSRLGIGCEGLLPARYPVLAVTRVGCGLRVHVFDRTHAFRRRLVDRSGVRVHRHLNQGPSVACRAGFCITVMRQAHGRATEQSSGQDGAAPAHGTALSGGIRQRTRGSRARRRTDPPSRVGAGWALA